MIFTELELPGAFLLDVETYEDHRGFFARSWCRREFDEHGLDARVEQSSISYNRLLGTLRGMHFQVAPAAETKLVRCTRGAIHDVIIDLRPGSPTYLQHVAAELTTENRRALYIPEGFAHGFQTLTDDAEVLYQMTTEYSPGHARGVRWNDPAFGIEWPIADPVILQRDARYADFSEAVLV
ncbi:MAG: dTDP-4-dehydrorhamnose 3,5-epimerase [Gemmatimonas sp.]|nr:dTDP-4-dehydrorhamnose 3,5-epimerase [Gemmatimonas sp.]